MTPPGHVFLVGMMASGKTSVGERLAARLERPFLDSDAEVERAAGRSIAAIFAEDGEAAFRALEAEAVARLAAAERPSVIALGGGAVLDEGTRRTIRASGRAVWLQAGADALEARLVEGAETRPILAGLSREARRAKLAEILTVRAPLYREVADLAIETDAGDAPGRSSEAVPIPGGTSAPATGGLSPDAVADEVARWLRRSRRMRVELGPRSYEVDVEAGGLASLGGRLARLGLAGRRAAIVTDANLAGSTALARVRAALAGRGMPEPTLSVLEPGEALKRLETAGGLLGDWATAGLDRGALVVALGGGVVTDIAGFAAAIYLRGVRWVAVPTTLLGMVDAAIGGKTGVNLLAGKNLAGAIHQPALVLCDPATLATLPAREVRSGLGEVLKYALIGPRALHDFVDRHVAALAEPGGLARHLERAAELVARCAEVKAGIVARDERETGGERKILNFGHTLGHAVEAASGFAIAHGDAVVLGMRAALHLSVEAGLLPFDEARALARLLERTGVPPLGPEVADVEVRAALLHDKKFAGGRRLFVLLAGQGAPRVDVEVAPGAIDAAIEVMRGLREVG